MKKEATLPRKHAWIKPDAKADYHSIIDGPVTQPNMTVRVEPQIMCGSWVTWLEGKSGCVACDALTPAE
jgi:hypothetical protein